MTFIFFSSFDVLRKGMVRSHLVSNREKLQNLIFNFFKNSFKPQIDVDNVIEVEGEKKGDKRKIEFKINKNAGYSCVGDKIPIRKDVSLIVDND